MNLLADWSTLPGVKSKDYFDRKVFIRWLNKVKEFCKHPRHLKVALNEIGMALIHIPKDNDLWINITATETLDSEDMRIGYESGRINSVNSIGKSFLELAEQYEAEAEEVDNAGYSRLAKSLKRNAKLYRNEEENN